MLRFGPSHLCAHRGFKNEDKISTQCLLDAMSSRRNVFFNTRTSEPLPACAHSPHHLRTYSGTVLRNLPSVQGFVSAQVLQRALTAAPRRSNAHSGTLTHNPKHQQQPAPSSSNPFIGQYYVTPSCHSLPFRVHFLCRCTSSSHSPTSSSSFHTLPQVTPPPLPLSRCPHLSAPTLTRTESHKKRSLRVKVQPQGSLLLSLHPTISSEKTLKNMSEALSLSI